MYAGIRKRRLIREVHEYKIDWKRQNNNSVRASRVLVHFFAVHIVKLHNFMGEAEHTKTNFLVRFVTWIQALTIPFVLFENRARRTLKRK